MTDDTTAGLPALKATYSTVAAAEIARAVEETYALGAVAFCELIRRGFNDVYEVRFESGGRCVARLAGLRARGPCNSAYEGALLAHLQSEGVAVGAAIPNAEGALWRVFAAPEGARTLMLLRWLDGAPPRANLDDVALMGRGLALIHTAGATYGTEASGIRASTAAEFSNRDAFVLTDGSGANRYPLRAGTDGATNSAPLTQAEARAVLEEAFTVMSRARAQIRRPLDSRAQVTISIVDTHGSVLGIVRSPDAPIFGTDVSLQKARSSSGVRSPSCSAASLSQSRWSRFCSVLRCLPEAMSTVKGRFLPARNVPSILRSSSLRMMRWTIRPPPRTAGASS